MVKAVASLRGAGRRGAEWVQVKRATRLDLVVFRPSGSRAAPGEVERPPRRCPRPRDAREAVQGAARFTSAPTRRRDRVRPCAGELPLSGRRRAQIRTGEGPPSRQVGRRDRHDRRPASSTCLSHPRGAGRRGERHRPRDRGRRGLHAPKHGVREPHRGGAVRRVLPTPGGTGPLSAWSTSPSTCFLEWTHEYPASTTCSAARSPRSMPSSRATCAFSA